MFVDDEQSVLRSLQRNLAIDFDVTVAHSAAEAQTLLGGPGKFDVIVTDVMMPGFNGLDFIEVTAPRFPETNFIVLTGTSDGATCERAESMPAVFRVLNKPCSRDQIVAAINDSVAQLARL